MADDKVIPVRVALRARPLVPKEINEGCQICLEFVSGEPQIIVGKDKAFTFDYTFPCDSKQKDLYNAAVSDRIEYLFKGYNVTVLAYGQTGSGKTYTMGTAYTTSAVDDSKDGIIQRAVRDIFSGIQQRSSTAEFLIKVSFLEVYKEDVFDLLQKRESPITIREDCDGIKIVGLTEQPVTSELETFRALEQGSLSRTTASTCMNARSSRSHAIFTIILEQRGLNNSMDFTRAKFHLVDLAGSERANKTGALGERFKEGVNINRGLLALGNVISALCDDASHVPYRDSKLTRLLQDSLGGNSHTVMVACVSPADSNLDETVNTLRYADRARKIKNKPVINRDPQNAELMRLRQQIQQMQIQLLQNQTMGSKKSADTGDKQNSEDIKILLERNKHLETENLRLAKELQHSIDQTTALCEKALLAEVSRDQLLCRLEELRKKTDELVEALMANIKDDPELAAQLQTLRDFQSKIAEIQCEQIQRDKEFSIYSPSKKNQLSIDEAQENGYSPAHNQEDSNSDSDNNVTNSDFNLKSTLKQAAMSRELQELERALALKEELADKMKENDSQMTVMRIQFESNLRQMEEEIAALNKEKEDLSNALKAAQASTNANKLAEQRRKRLQELETQIANLKKQMQEKEKLMRIKQEAERKVSVLQQEIQSMKTARVRLLKQIREEAERFRALKKEKDREVAQLKQQDRKRQYEMTKLKQEFAKQKTVLKRKMEEASAANKRLNDALQQQKHVAERRMKEKQSSIQGIGSRVQQWLNQEIEVVLSSKEAQHHLQNLLENRKIILEQLKILKSSMDSEEPPKKKKSLDGEDNDISTEERKEASEQIKLLEKEFQMINIQISDLQQKILDVDQDEKVKHRWESIQGMVEAKCALKWLFECVINAKMDNFLQASSHKFQVDSYENELNSTREKLKKANEEKEKLQQRCHNIVIEFEEKIAAISRESEEKMLYLLKQLNSSNKSASSSGNESAVERMHFLENEITRLSYLHEEVQKKEAENEKLKQELARAHYKGKKPKLLDDICDMNVTRTLDKPDMSMMEDFLDEELSDTNSDKDDPDWKYTPLCKRTKALTQKLINGSSTETDKKSKNVSCSGCSCQGNCGTMKCGCKKKQKNCSGLCRCNAIDCVNRDTTDESALSKSEDSDSASLNTTYSKENKQKAVLSEINHESVKNISNNDSDFVAPRKNHEQRKKKKYRKDREDGNSIIDENGIKKRTFLERSQKLQFFSPVN